MLECRRRNYGSVTCQRAAVGSGDGARPGVAARTPSPGRPGGGPRAGPPRATAVPTGPLRRAGPAASRPGVGRPRGRSAVGPPGRGDRRGARRALRRARHRHGLGQVALLPGPHRRGRAGPPPAQHRAVHLPHQGPGPGPGPIPLRAGPARPRARHLRRRLLHRGADLGPWPRDRAAHQPRDAALGPAPPPRQVVHLPGPPGARRGRRAARAAGHLRHPCLPPAAPPPAGVQPLRLGPHLRLLLGHHRPTRPPGVRALRPARHRDHRRRLPQGGAPRRPLEPGGRGDRRPRSHRPRRRTGEGRSQAVHQQGDGRPRRPPGPGGAPHHRLLP